MPSAKLSVLADLAGGQVSTDLAYVVDVSAGAAGSRKSTLNDLFSIITKNITDGAVRFQGTFLPAVSAANQGALYFNDTSDTFQGSRNGSAYENLLFGAGSAQQVAVFGSPVDKINGFASFIFDDVLTIATISAANVLPTLTIANTTAATPSRIRAGGGIAYISMKGFQSASTIDMGAGVSGPAFPGSGIGLGAILFGVTNDPNNIVNNTLASIQVTTTQVATGGLSGVGMAIRTVNNAAQDQPRITITGDGAVAIGSGVGVTATLGGPTTDVVLGNLTTFQSDTSIQLGNAQTGPTTQKTVIIQANAGQTASVLGTQSSGGGDQFQIRVVPGDSNHFISLLGTTTQPPLSVATQWRIYANQLGQLLISEGGGAYQRITGGGGSIGGTVSGGTTGSVLFVGAAGALSQDNANFFWDDTNNRLGIRTTTPTARLNVNAAAGDALDNPWGYFGVPLSNFTVDQQDLVQGSGIQSAVKNSELTGNGVSAGAAFINVSNLADNYIWGYFSSAWGDMASGTDNQIFGGECDAYANSGAGTVSIMNGLTATATATNTGNITEMTGVSTLLLVNKGAGTVTNLVGFDLVSSVITAGAVTNAYGLRIAALPSAATNKFSIHTTGDFPSRFGGAIGSNVTPTAQIHAVSASASRVGQRIDSAATPTVDIAQFTINGSTTAGAYTGVMTGGTIFTPRNVVTGTGTQNLNFALGNIQQFTFGAGNATFTFSNIPNSALLTIVIIQDGTGGRTLTWPATAKFIMGIAPTLSVGANARDIIQFYSDGTNIYQVSAIALAVA